MATADVVRLQISKQSRASNRAGFGRALALAINAPLVSWGADRIKTYVADDSGLLAVKAAFGLGSEEYAFAVQLLSQNVRPDFFYFGQRQAAVPVEKSIVLSAPMAATHTITVTINGKEITQTFVTDSAATYAAFETKVEGCPGVAACVVSSNTFQIEAEPDWPLNIDGLEMGGTTPPTANVTVQEAGRTVNADIAELTALSREWYALCSLDRSAGHIWEAARGIQAADRLFLPVSLDGDVIDDTEELDIMSRLQALAFDRTALSWHDKSAEYIDAAVAGRFLPLAIGQKIFANKPLTGCTLPALTADEAGALKAKGANFINDVSGRGWYYPGKTADGGFIDTRLNLDYMHVNILARVLDGLERQTIIPYTQPGVDLVRSWVADELERMKTVDGFIVNYEVAPIDVTKVAANKRDNRILPDLVFNAKFAGAIQEVEVRGTVEV